MTHPREKHLQDSLDRLTEVRWGLQAYLDRVAEWSDDGFPSGGSGSSSSSFGRPTEARLDDEGRRHPDPAKAELRAFDRQVDRMFVESRKLHKLWANVCDPPTPAARQSDPGCELCAEISLARPTPLCKACRPHRACDEHGGYGHWSPTYVTTDVEVGTPKKPKAARLALCYWCWHKTRPVERGGWGRIPTKDERLAHAEGRRVRVSA